MFRKIYFFLLLLSLSTLFVGRSYSLSAYCEIVTFGQNMDSKQYTGVFISPFCTAKDLDEYEKSLKDQKQQNNFANFISKFMSGKQLDQDKTYSNMGTFLNSILPSSPSPTGVLPTLFGTMVAIGGGSAKGNSPQSQADFEKTFGVPFNSQNLGKYIAAGALGAAASSLDFTPSDSQQIAQALMGGYNVVNLIQSGTLQTIATQIGNNLALGFKAIVFGEHEPDYIADANIRVEQAAVTELYDNYRNALVDWASKINVNSYNLSVASDLEWKVIEGEQAQSQQDIQGVLDEIKANQNQIDVTKASVSTLLKTTEADLEKTESAWQIKEYKDGLLSQNAIDDNNLEITSQLSTASTTNPLNGLDKISSLENLMFNETNPLVAAQRKNALKNFIDDNGIVIAYSTNEEKIKGYAFHTSFSDTYNTPASLVRNAVNEALALKYFADTPEKLEQGNVALDLALEADEAYGQNRAQWGDRYVMDSMEIASYAAHDIFYNDYASTQLNANAQNTFHLNQKADTYEGFKTIELANSMANIIAKNPTDENFTFLSKMALAQMAESQAQGNLKSFETATKNGWFLVDCAKGVTEGLWQFTKDTVTGVVQLVNHPIDSAEAMLNAVINYRETTRVILQAIERNIARFPTMTLEEQTAFVTETAADVLTTFLPLGEVKTAAEVEKISAATKTATELVVKKYKHLIPADYVEKVPGGGLVGQEAKGAHVLERHVSGTQDYLKNRSKKKYGAAMSSFTDLKTAEDCVFQVLQDNNQKIETWKNTPSVVPEDNILELFNTQPSSKVNGYFYKAKNKTSGPTYNTTVVLLKDPSQPEGYRVITAYPNK